MPMYRYAVLEHDQDFDDSVAFFSPQGPPFNSLVVEDAAWHKHNVGNGWESSWPLTFLLWGIHGEFLGKYRVDRRLSPSFTVWKAIPL